MQSAIAVTPNQTVNGVFVSRAQELFHVPRGYVAVAAFDTGIVSEMVEEGPAEILFEDAHDVERWDVRFRHAEVEVIHCIFESPGAASDAIEPARLLRQGNREQSVMLAIRRDESIVPMFRRFVPRVGDVATIVLHNSDRDAALAALCERGWKRLDPQSESSS